MAKVSDENCYLSQSRIFLSCESLESKIIRFSYSMCILSIHYLYSCCKWKTLRLLRVKNVNNCFFVLGFVEKGSVWVAQTSDRLHTLKRQYAIIKSLGINCEILNVEKIKEKIPIIDPHEIWVTNKIEFFI